ncbi:unnamed protein product [Coregonus sp. 'balchen']|nr:unnamed protein product [Coregonus sp. 'balchen']
MMDDESEELSVKRERVSVCETAIERVSGHGRHQSSNKLDCDYWRPPISQTTRCVTSICVLLSVKRPAGMGSILNRLGGKKQKMSTLEKSKMDWDAFKDEEGIGDELAIHNRGKEGYVERKNFLQRVDHRQFEQEKKVRLGNIMKR